MVFVVNFNCGMAFELDPFPYLCFKEITIKLDMNKLFLSA